MSEPFDRLLVFAPNWLGDAVMAVPCLGAIRRHYPRLALAVAARSHLAPLFEMVDGIDEVVRLEPAGRPGGWLAAWRDARRLRAARFDVAILLPNSFRTAWIARRAGIAERWGYAADLRTRMLTRAVPRLGGGHQVQYYQRLLDGLGIRSDFCIGHRTPDTGRSDFDTGHRTPDTGRSDFDTGHRTPDTGRSDLPAVRIDVPGDAREWARAMLASRGRKAGDHLVGMAPGAAYGSAKQWPPDRFAQLAIELAQTGVTTVLVGSASDRAACDEVARAAAGGCINLAGATDLRQLAAVMAECRSFVSNDSGAMHLAAAVGVPVVAIFGPTNEHETSPLPIAVKTDRDEFQNLPGQQRDGGQTGKTDRDEFQILPGGHRDGVKIDGKEFPDPPGVPRAAHTDVAGIEIRPDLILRSHAIVTADVWCRPCMLRECPLDHGCMTRISVAQVKTEVMKLLHD